MSTYKGPDLRGAAGRLWPGRRWRVGELAGDGVRLALLDGPPRPRLDGLLGAGPRGHEPSSLDGPRQRVTPRALHIGSNGGGEGDGGGHGALSRDY
jgi:hypothetical protein